QAAVQPTCGSAALSGSTRHSSPTSRRRASSMGDVVMRTEGPRRRSGVSSTRLRHHARRHRLRGHGYFSRLGPRLVTGAADDDPSGIGTSSQVGAAFGYSLLWSTVLVAPMAAAVQETAARLGLVTGKGLSSLIRARFPRPILSVALALTVVANTFNI